MKHKLILLIALCSCTQVGAQTVVPSITNLSSGQVIQRNPTCSITISGSVGPGTHTIEAQWGNGSWTVIQSSASSTYSGSLAGIAAGWSTASIRWQDTPSITASVPFVGCGDRYLLAGQSNMVGEGTNLQTYTYLATNPPSKFGGDYAWHLGGQVDPMGAISVANNTLWVDAVNRNTAMGGSIWPQFITQWINNTSTQNVPVAFVPCAEAGTSSTDWQPGASHTDRTTEYGACVYRAKQAAQSSETLIVRAVQWLQGETDAYNGVAQATYLANMQVITDAFFADLGAPTIVAKLESWAVGCGHQAGMTAIQAAHVQLWGTHHALQGPDLSDLMTDNCSPHFLTDGNMTTIGGRWFTADKTALGL